MLDRLISQTVGRLIGRMAPKWKAWVAFAIVVVGGLVSLFPSDPKLRAALHLLTAGAVFLGVARADNSPSPALMRLVPSNALRDFPSRDAVAFHINHGYRAPEPSTVVPDHTPEA